MPPVLSDVANDFTTPLFHVAIFGKSARTMSPHCYTTGRLDIQPGNVDALVSLGRIETRAGETETAEQHLSDAIAADDQSAAALVALANLARKKGDGVAAVEYLKRAADAAPEAVEPLVFLGQISVRSR